MARYKYKKAHTPWNKGKKWSPNLRKIMLAVRRTKKYRKKMSDSHTGSKNPMYGRTQEKSPYWKGEAVSYSGLHHWVLKYNKKKPARCSRCKQKRSSIDWANVDGRYRRVLSDWVALCRPCHRVHDRGLPMGKNGYIKNHT